MGQPGTVEVCTTALRAEAASWDRQSDRLAGIAVRADGLHWGRIEAGIFQVVVSTYDSVVDWVAARCGEGRRRTSDIATALRDVANGYDATDRGAAQIIRQSD
jgi:hypothetical protein